MALNFDRPVFWDRNRHDYVALASGLLTLVERGVRLLLDVYLSLVVLVIAQAEAVTLECWSTNLKGLRVDGSRLAKTGQRSLLIKSGCWNHDRGRWLLKWHEMVVVHGRVAASSLPSVCT